MRNQIHPDLARLRWRLWLTKSADELLEHGQRWVGKCGKLFLFLIIGWFSLCCFLAPQKLSDQLGSAISGSADIFMLRGSRASEQSSNGGRPSAKRSPKSYISPYK